MLETCPACGKEVFFLQETLYEGFQKVGEQRRCTACGFTERTGDIPRPKPATLSPLFSLDELPERPDLFQDGENQRMCHYCTHYVTNPFTQRCMLHGRAVEATDTCPQFAAPES